MYQISPRGCIICLDHFGTGLFAWCPPFWHYYGLLGVCLLTIANVDVPVQSDILYSVRHTLYVICVYAFVVCHMCVCPTCTYMLVLLCDKLLRASLLYFLPCVCCVCRLSDCNLTSHLDLFSVKPQKWLNDL